MPIIAEKPPIAIPIESRLLMSAPFSGAKLALFGYHIPLPVGWVPESVSARRRRALASQPQRLPLSIGL